MILLTVRKVDQILRVENSLGHVLCALDNGAVKFFEPVTLEELHRINMIAQDYDFVLANTIEE